MSKEETSMINKRVTRSASCAPPKGGSENVVACDPVHTSWEVNDLLFSDSTISLEELLSSFPGRESQIHEMLRLIGPLDSPMIPLFIYGNVSTGKTSVILRIFRYLNRPFVYSSCRSCYNPKILFESVLNQLLINRKKPSNNYASAKRCEKFTDFVNLLRDSLGHVIQDREGCSKNANAEDDRRQRKGRMLYLIFDNLELIRNWDRSSTILPLLFKLHNILDILELGLIFISNSSLDTYYASIGFIEPFPIHFPVYSEGDLYQIFMRNQENPKLYSSFLDVVLKPFVRITRRVDELSIALQPLFLKYCEPLNDMKLVPDETTKRRLFSHLQPHIAPSLNQILTVFSPSPVDADKENVSRMGKNGSITAERYDMLNFHMSVSARYLLISSFLASRNPATLDAALFDSTGGSEYRRRKRSKDTIMQKKDEVSDDQHMRGPGTFPLERLLSTLCNANFLSKAGSCLLEGPARYRCLIDEEMALKVARSLNFPLSKYIYRR